ncbi:MAG: 16S rRNA (adenine(1518)-N(6)/adenine(1519)-N(6))-dimethyltransferase RsmA [Pseudomonadales bacterium]|jgi:16S rRNA (adenine1518-N6/adenine1519-N6)-dimethyltransferase|nr:16S rRNA (adenine(1518)-N(6)/adenine(1519)-N(6))-dimethyltransferase RsmA [Pseudomonadales bacterium]
MTSEPGRPAPGRGAGFSGHRARKRFSQNFLVDDGIVRRIVAAIDPQPTDHVVEIGPGRGAITGLLEASGCDLTVVEIDRDLAQGLRLRYPDLRLIEGDALRLDYGALFDPPHPFRIVGNLPYNISTPLLFHLLDHARWLRDAHFMLQDEVVQRLAASPGQKAWGRLGVMIRYRCEVEPLFGVPQSAFTPRPQVRSRIVRLIPRDRPVVEADDEALFARVVRAVFAQRRKTLRNGLKSLPFVGEVAFTMLEEAGVDLRLRPEMLSVDDFVRIANLLAPLQSEAVGD